MNSIQTFVIVSLIGILISLNFQFLGQGSYSYIVDMHTISIIISIALSTAIVVHTIRQNGDKQ
ncbi:MAG: hypothetical protein IJI66_03400 [Erysipelotrichaceae bacterium]|nr:hypothetical protein [Erysipelotrichaceae bacterium]